MQVAPFGLATEVAVPGGEIEPVPSITLPNPQLVDVSPDGSTFLVKSYEKGFSVSAPLYSVRSWEARIVTWLTE